MRFDRRSHQACLLPIQNTTVVNQQTSIQFNNHQVQVIRQNIASRKRHARQQKDRRTGPAICPGISLTDPLQHVVSQTTPQTMGMRTRLDSNFSTRTIWRAGRRCQDIGVEQICQFPWKGCRRGEHDNHNNATASRTTSMLRAFLESGRRHLPTFGLLLSGRPAPGRSSHH
jgi:hypothetical protein